MADLSKYKKMLERLNGLDKTVYNKQEIKALQKLAGDQAVVNRASEEALSSKLLNSAKKPAEPLTHNPFESLLQNVDPTTLPDNSTKGIILPKAEAPVDDLSAKLADVDLSRFNKGSSGVYADLSPSGQHLPGSGVYADLSEMSPLASKWAGLKELAANNKGKIAAGVGAGGLAVNLYSGSDNLGGQAQAGTPNTQVTANQPVPKEISEPISEEEKELGRQIQKLSMESVQSGKAGNKAANPEEKTVIDFGDNTLANAEALKAAQDRAGLLGGFANLRDSHAGMAYALAGLDKPDKLVGGANMRKLADSIVPQYEKRVAFEKEDPNSAQSKGYRELAKSMGFEIKGAASAADLEKQFPQLANIYNQKEARSSRESENALNREAALNGIRLKMSQMKDAKGEKLSEKDEDRLLKLNQQMNAPNMGSARNALGRNQLIINGADKIEALIKSAKNPDQLTGRQVYEIAKSLDGMLSMGSPTISGTEHLLPKTLMSQLASGGEYMMNKPVGAKMGAFVNQMHELIAREREVAHSQIGAFKQQFMGGLPGDFTKRRQSDIDRLIKAHADTAGSEAPTGASGLSPEARLKRIEELKAKQGK